MDRSPSQYRTDDIAAALARVGAAVDDVLARGLDDPVPRRAAWTDALDIPLPASGVGPDAVLDEFLDVLVPNGSVTVDPGFWGWIVTAPPTVPTAVTAASMIVAPHRYGITAFNLVEEMSLRWVADLCGLGEHMRGVYSSGGSTANLVALGAARQWAFEQLGRDVAASGTDGTPVAIYASAEVHHTIQRSAAVLGLGRACVRLVPADEHQRIRLDVLQTMLAADSAEGIVPIAVVASAGTTNTGAVDPLRAVGALAQEFGAWFHVDGAYGLAGILDERVAPLYDGLELADSVITDPHKWLGVPVGTAATFVRDRALLHRAFTQEPADYLEVQAADASEARTSLDAMGIPYSEFGLELTAPARGVAVWASLRELGRDGMAARIRQDNDHAARVADEVRAHPRLELLSEPTLSIVCFRYRPEDADRVDLDAVNAEILRLLHLQTPYLPSSTRVGGAYAIRPCFINPRTQPRHLDGFTATVVELGDRLTARASSEQPPDWS